jgi:hypothetical protein
MRSAAVLHVKGRDGGFGTMVEIFDFEAARARIRVKSTVNSLRRANELLDKDRGVALNLALCTRIRAEQRRVIDARERLVKIDPNTGG